MQSKFSTRVAMRCTSNEQADKSLAALDDISRSNITRSSQNIKIAWVATGDLDWGGLITYRDDPPSNPEYTLIPEYNLPLFKALAARREGDEFYPGEWVESTRDVKHIGFVFKNHSTDDSVTRIIWIGKTYSEANNSDPAPKKYLRKLTVEEILAHFKEKEQPAEQKYRIAYFEEAKWKPAEIRWNTAAPKTSDLFGKLSSEDGSVTITSEAFREIWRAVNPSFRNYLCDAFPELLESSEFEFSEANIRNAYTHNREVTAILDKHFKREEVFTSDKLAAYECMFCEEGEAAGSVIFALQTRNVLFSVSTDRELKVWSGLQTFKGKKLPAGTPITFHSL